MTRTLFLLPLCALLTSCASIFGSTKEKISLTADVEDVQVTISNAKNETVQTVTLPATVELKKKKGYFSGQQYHLKAEKKGYEPHEQVAETTISAWYFGNILIGGAIGMLAVDPVTGSMWTFKEDEYNFSMQKAKH